MQERCFALQEGLRAGLDDSASQIRNTAVRTTAECMERLRWCQEVEFSEDGRSAYDAEEGKIQAPASAERGSSFLLLRGHLAAKDYLVVRRIGLLSTEEPPKAAGLDFDVHVVESAELPPLLGVLVDDLLELPAHLTGA